jgi:hypothetical protein
MSWRGRPHSDLKLDAEPLKFLLLPLRDDADEVGLGEPAE